MATITQTFRRPAARQRYSHPARRRPQLHRRIQFVEVLPGEIYKFYCYSLSRKGKEVRHQQEIDLQTSEARCSCEHFTYRLARFHPAYNDTENTCEHIKRAVHWLKNHAVIPCSETVCSQCKSDTADSYFPLADENGEPVPGLICIDCITAAMDDESDSDYEAESLAPPCPPGIDPQTGEILPALRYVEAARRKEHVCLACATRCRPPYAFCYRCNGQLPPLMQWQLRSYGQDQHKGPRENNAYTTVVHQCLELLRPGQLDQIIGILEAPQLEVANSRYFADDYDGPAA